MRLPDEKIVHISRPTTIDNIPAKPPQRCPPRLACQLMHEPIPFVADRPIVLLLREFSKTLYSAVCRRVHDQDRDVLSPKTSCDCS